MKKVIRIQNKITKDKGVFIMKKFYKIITLMLTCVMLFGMISVNAYATNDNQVFSDVKPGTWYYEAVNTMAQNGLLAGYSDGKFHPTDPITYGQFASILCRITGTPTASTTGENYLGSNHWAAYAIQNILQTDIFIRNYSKADEVLWRAEAFEALANMTKHMSKYNYSYETQMTDKVWTWDDIPDADIVTYHMGSNYIAATKQYGNHCWTWPMVLKAYNLGITSGTDSRGTCDPTGTVTRAQVCQMLYNMGISGPNCVTIRGGSGILG